MGSLHYSICREGSQNQVICKLTTEEEEEIPSATKKMSMVRCSMLSFRHCLPPLLLEAIHVPVWRMGKHSLYHDVNCLKKSL